MTPEALERMERGRGPWPGGTWSGRCGSVTWIEQPENEVLHYRQRFTETPHVTTAQAHHMHGFNDAGGFPVECRKPHDHEGDCWAGPFTWETPPVEVLK